MSSGVSRRGFVKVAATALPVAALPACGNGIRQDAPAGRALDAVILRALAGVVLPAELGDDGLERAVSGFERWLASYRPVAERNHGYGTGEIRYTSPDPAPGWKAQLEAYDMEARQRFGSGFAALDADRRLALVRARLAQQRSLPEPAQAAEVALGLIAWWTASPEANDLCYGVAIGRLACRPLDRSPERPSPLKPEA